MPSELEIAMESLIKVFHRYASKEGRSGTLSRRELRELMENELSNFLRVWTRAERGHVTCDAAVNASCARLSLRRTPLRWTKSWRTWTPTATARWTSKSLCPWWWDCPLLVSSAIRRTWGRLEGCEAFRLFNTEDVCTGSCLSKFAIVTKVSLTFTSLWLLLWCLGLKP